MKVIVVGAGVIGVSSAHYLNAAGCTVTLLDALPGPALGTSYANAGQVSPGYAAPWAAPGIPFKALRWLFDRDAPLKIRPDGSWFQLVWMARMLANCSHAAYDRNKARMVPLAEYSRDCLRSLRAELGLHYDERSLGTLQLLRDPAQLVAARRDAAILERIGVPHQLLDVAGVLEHEPALARVAHRVAGGLRLPNDETGDCRRFTERLAEHAASAGVQTRYGSDIAALLYRNGRVTGVRLADGEELAADAVVLAAGCASRALAQPLRLALPVYPVKGYSITLPLTDPDAAPRSTVLDETNKVALTRFDTRLRVGGMAEVAGFDLRIRPERVAVLKRVTTELFPEAGDLAEVEAWTGLRPMTPDGTPLVGASGVPGLWLNTGHGTLGWTMACGSAQLLADLMLGRPAALPARDYTPARYSRAEKS
ncbi:D-amino acid dehydrogenase [Jeongeupia chitinilytica]|uniref:D-amino acid dehydrogenase n=1 Tax=Jeongeupia chitinilytica TaxID=1041641 RepID=A0ABQ3GZV4_9NEIS|nr:D-amino acid dehydrogenase [Jeongeupia chitinilytica]GHD62432.1 D-amino acid dehydrogenase [Jeongeupia chitinilytica]